MELLPYADEHLWLTEALECDPETMRDLGGPVDPAEIPRVHKMRVDTVANGEWYFVIMPEPGGSPAGSIGIWRSALAGETVDEIGWMVLPDFRGRGIATEALRAILDRARREARFEQVHAFPGTANAASNALCRRARFVHRGELDVRWRDRPLRVNHWVLDI